MTLIGKQKGVKQVEIKMTAPFPPTADKSNCLYLQAIELPNIKPRMRDFCPHICSHYWAIQGFPIWTCILASVKLSVEK